MAVTGDVVSETLIKNIASQIDQLGLLMKGLGVVAIVWIIYIGVMFWLEKKQLDKIKDIGEAVKRMERKINRIKRAD